MSPRPTGQSRSSREEAERRRKRLEEQRRKDAETQRRSAKKGEAASPEQLANPIEQAARAIRNRLAELFGEQKQLQKALGALEGLLGSERGSVADAPASAKARRLPSPRVSVSAQRRSTGTRRRHRTSRADQFLKLASEQPGITVAEAAERLGASRQTLYNVTARLQREGRLRKDGRSFYPVEQPAAEEVPDPPSASA